MKKIHILKSIVILLISIILISWGNQGHYKINYNSSFSFNAEMSDFQSWASLLAAHASDADYRKQWDYSESPKHYIDIDNYTDFINNGEITMTLNEAITKYGSYFVYQNGVLPWATIAAFDTLQKCFERGEWNRAMLTASDLGHYAGDGHQPFHITRNYDGQYTGNDGIHSRYESYLIGDYLNQIVYEGMEIELVADIQSYVFNYIYENHKYVDSLIIADNYAQGLAGNDYSDEYYAALWSKCGTYTIDFFKGASNSLAELIYTAWVNAGSPMVQSGIQYFETGNSNLSVTNFPNPFSSSTTINYYLSESNDVEVKIIDIYGNTVELLTNDFLESGEHEIIWNADDLSSGMYIISVKTPDFIENKFIVKF